MQVYTAKLLFVSPHIYVWFLPIFFSPYERLLSYTSVLILDIPLKNCEWKALLTLSHSVVLHHAWIVYYVYQEGMRNDFPREWARWSAGRLQVSGELHLTASADRSPQDSLNVIDMSGNEQSALSVLPFNCVKCVLERFVFFDTCWSMFYSLGFPQLLTNVFSWLFQLFEFVLGFLESFCYSRYSTHWTWFEATKMTTYNKCL